MRHAGQVVTRTMLLESVWDYHFDPQTNVIDVHISRLRQKIDKGFDRAAAAHRARRWILPACRDHRFLGTTHLPAGAALCRAVRAVGRRALRVRLLDHVARARRASASETVFAEAQALVEQLRLLRACTGSATRSASASGPDRGRRRHLSAGRRRPASRSPATSRAGRSSPAAAGGWIRVPGRARASSAIAKPCMARAPCMSSLPGGYHLLVGQRHRGRRSACSAAVIRGSLWGSPVTLALGARRRPGDEPQPARPHRGDQPRDGRRIRGGEVTPSHAGRAARRRVRPARRTTSTRMLDEIERLMGGIRAVTDNIAHDLRSPLDPPEEPARAGAGAADPPIGAAPSSARSARPTA